MAVLSRQEMVEILLDDMEEWDEDQLRTYALIARKHVLQKVNFSEVIAEYKYYIGF